MEQVLKEGRFTEEILPNPCTEDEIQESINKAKNYINKNKLYNPDRKNEVVLGKAMQDLRGRVDGKKVMTYL